MRVGATIGAVVTEILRVNGNPQKLQFLMTAFYSAAYREGYSDCRQDGHDTAVADSQDEEEYE